MVDEALTILLVLASDQEAKFALMKANEIPILLDIFRAGLPCNKENATNILLSLCKRYTKNLACLSKLRALLHLSDLAQSGRKKRKRKPTSFWSSFVRHDSPNKENSLFVSLI